MLLNEIPRSAISVWCQLASNNRLLAVGTLSGAFNSDFDSNSKLEIWNALPQDSPTSKSNGLLNGISVPEKFTSLVWLPIQSNENSLGLISGILSSGSVGIWNPNAIINEDSDPCLFLNKGPSGSVISMDFSAKQSNLIAFGCSNGELVLWNLSNAKTPTFHRPGNIPPSQLNSKLTDVSFNPSYKHILATSSSNGNMIIWDLRQKRHALSFSINNNNRLFNVSCIKWCPDQPMKMVVSSDDDDCPDISFWDLSLNLAPIMSLKGHSRGITSMSWSHKYTSLLLSTGKDLNTICWDMDTGMRICDVGYSSNWNFKVEWANKWPNVFNTCSLDGKLRIYHLSDFENLATEESRHLAETQTSNQATKIQQQNFKEVDFLNVVNATALASNMNLISTIKRSRLLENGAKIPHISPQWLRRPNSVSFGFSGFIIAFSISGIINQYHITTDEILVERASKLQNALLNKQLKVFCHEKIATSSTSPPSSPSSSETWKNLYNLTEYSDHKIFTKTILNQFNLNDEKVHLDVKSQVISDKKLLPPQSEDEKDNTKTDQKEPTKDGSGVSNDFSSSNELFGDDDDCGTDIFTFNLSSVKTQQCNHNTPQSSQISHPAPPLLPYVISTKPIKFDSKEVFQNVITKFLLIGDLKSAVEYCIKFERLDDALVLSSLGDENLVNFTKVVYLNKKKDQSLTAIVEVLISRNWGQFIERIDLEHWQNALSLLYHYIEDDTFYLHVKRLGQRLKDAKCFKSAILCFLCSNSFEELGSLWITEAESTPTEKCSVNPLILQDYVEKCIVFICTSMSSKIHDINIPNIFLDYYTRYIEFLVNENALQVALGYLSLIIDLLNSKSSSNAAITSLYDRICTSLPPDVVGNVVQNFESFWNNYTRNSGTGELEISNSNVSSPLSMDSSSYSVNNTSPLSANTSSPLNNSSLKGDVNLQKNTNLFRDQSVPSPSSNILSSYPNADSRGGQATTFNRATNISLDGNVNVGATGLNTNQQLMKPEFSKFPPYNKSSILNFQKVSNSPVVSPNSFPIQVEPTLGARLPQSNKPGATLSPKKQYNYDSNVSDGMPVQMPPKPSQSRIRAPTIDGGRLGVLSPSQIQNDTPSFPSPGYSSGMPSLTQESLTKAMVPPSRSKISSRGFSSPNSVMGDQESAINPSTLNSLPLSPMPSNSLPLSSVPSTFKPTSNFNPPKKHANQLVNGMASGPSISSPPLPHVAFGLDSLVAPKMPPSSRIHPQNDPTVATPPPFSPHHPIPPAEAKLATMHESPMTRSIHAPTGTLNPPTFTPPPPLIPTLPTTTFTPPPQISSTTFTPPIPNTSNHKNTNITTITPPSRQPSHTEVQNTNITTTITTPSRQPSHTEIQAIKTLRDLLNNVCSESLSDLPSRIDYLEQKIYTESILPAAPSLIEFSQAINQKDFAKAEQIIHEISRKAYKTVGSKIIIALNRILKIAKDKLPAKNPM